MELRNFHSALQRNFCFNHGFDTAFVLFQRFNIDLAQRDLERGKRRRDRKFQPLGAICNAAFVGSVYIYVSSFLREEGSIDEESGFRFRAREDYSSRAEIASIFNDPFQLSRLEKMKRRRGGEGRRL